MPRLFGDPGAEASPLTYAIRSIAPACVSKEFAAFAANRTAPVTGWLRALAADAHETLRRPGRRRARHVLHRRVRARR